MGQTLTAGVGTIEDANVLPTFPGDYTFQWQRLDADGTNPVDIQGATSQTYALTADDAGRKVTVTVSFSDGANNPETRPSLKPGPAGGTVEFPALTIGFEDDATRYTVEGDSVDVAVVLSGPPGRPVTIPMSIDTPDSVRLLPTTRHRT